MSAIFNTYFKRKRSVAVYISHKKHLYIHIYLLHCIHTDNHTDIFASARCLMMMMTMITVDITYHFLARSLIIMIIIGENKNPKRRSNKLMFNKLDVSKFKRWRRWERTFETDLNACQ